jgi:4-amino-4-deoxychorismate lyase
MSLLFETIRISDVEARHLQWHEGRMNRARLELWNIREPVNLREIIRVPSEFRSGLVRCNVHYGPYIESITFKLYDKKSIRSLRMVKNDTIDYHVKYFDRSLLESLLDLRGECDDIMIIKNGLVTDTSMSNLIFSDGTNWVTPAKPLLRGTCRERLLSEGKISIAAIHSEDIYKYTGVKLINAMRDPEEEEMILISNVKDL